MTQIIYVTSPESQQIYVWKLDEQHKKLNLIQVISTTGQGQPVVVHPTKRVLYVGIRPDFRIVTYSINQLGCLEEMGSTRIFTSPTYLAINAQGTFLYCVSYQYNTVSVYPINMLGIINKSVQSIQGLLGCHSIGIDKNKQLMWIPCLKENSIRLFKVNVSGILTQSHSMFVKNNIITGPRHIVLHSTDCYAYVINELNGTIDVINYNYSKKKLNIVQTLNIIPKKVMHVTRYWSADIHVAPNEKWLYCSDRAMNIISYFNISHKTKQLKFINYQSTEVQPRGFAIDSTGQFLIVAGQKSNYIALYYIHQNNGELNFLSRYYSGVGPVWISIFRNISIIY